MCKKIKETFESNTKPTKEMVQNYSEYKELFQGIAEKIVKNVCESNEREIALVKLQEVSMWLNKAIFHYEKRV